jgi:hypothetical protein
MRIQHSAAFVVMGGLLLAGCSVPASDARAAPVGTESPTAVPAAGNESRDAANSVAATSGRFAIPLPSGSPVEPEVALSEEESAANTAYIDSFLAEQWKAGTKPSTLSAARPGDCVFFDWEYSSGPTQTALFPVPCDEPHESEVFGVVTHGDRAFPGELALDRAAGSVCGDFIMQHLSSLAPGLSFRALSPTEADWKGGERNSVCLYSPPGLLSERSHFRS